MSGKLRANWLSPAGADAGQTERQPQRGSPSPREAAPERQTQRGSPSPSPSRTQHHNRNQNNHHGRFEQLRNCGLSVAREIKREQREQIKESERESERERERESIT